MTFSILTLVLAICILTTSVQVSAGPVQHATTRTIKPWNNKYDTNTVGPIMEPGLPTSPLPKTTQELDELAIKAMSATIKAPAPGLPTSPLPKTTQELDDLLVKAVPETIMEPALPTTLLPKTTQELDDLAINAVLETIKAPAPGLPTSPLPKTTQELDDLSIKAVPEPTVATTLAIRVREVVPRPRGPDETKIAPELSNGVSDRVMTLFLVAVGFFFVSLIWHLYIRVGWDRDGAKQLDKRAVGAMELGRLASTNQADVERSGKGKAKGAGLWLREANKVS
ncbi:hypothetical protein LTR20_007455 [Exophiala xenobiotica]|nr:hypothetical protein LTR92_007330 [Exophiala xenobiotica]KAK5367154.1 hypothetical protein LTS13_008007 [Exophiala xenobiotica]KAK5401318.1 hypothetical protein LTR79_001837 [Exophiala xenobiotica]KAK5407039.1 hypothetical protein LTR90_010296 [Exophiala xenobiotica]KAK5460148.1 hypothetical protein LTR20_007455 [Exophiala xenobiotica]